MSRNVKNLYFEIVKSLELNPELFGFIEDGQELTFQLLNSPLSYSVSPISGPGLRYQCVWNVYAPGFPQDGEVFEWDIKYVANHVAKWMLNSVQPYLADMEKPDLWTQYVEGIESIPAFKTFEGEFEQFSDDEKFQIKQSISNYRILVIENYNPTDEQLEEINEKLDYISQAVERLNRRDWIGVAISTVIGIGINLGVDTEGGRRW